ncbi:hypothetical protein [Nitrospirillum viridazoti]|uniref:Uncharacterized protein n=1 Tax=Nitrospirillum viridazoti CBAmc TaxID=1441467 RepID=A0A248K286_9PROT|nr:hypothetical protein [Nitrospirillum amazonense]ASG25052.1 hypothetical protein Y958_29200 [Nitrospirillum amazonense CBAmc]TWB31194.1 hypothetical protein FBZ91_1202 [Nitrospirillum amazonense]
MNQNFSVPLLVLVLLPGILALPLLLTGVMIGPGAMLAALLLLGTKAVAARRLRGGGPLADLPFDVAGELLMPLHAMAGGFRSSHIRWRGRRMVLSGKRITDG